MASIFPFSVDPVLIGMVHLDALPGAPDFCGDMAQVVDHAAADARVLAEAGFDGVMVENFYDAPFYKDDLPPETIAGLTRCALAVAEAAPGLVLGINALRNDALAALGIAAVVGARFIRVNVLTGAMVTDQGLIEGRAAQVIRRRAALGLPVAVFADVAVKHAAPLAALDLAQSARDMVYRGKADALVVSGTGTGEPTPPGRLHTVRAAVPGVPVFVGSGVRAQTVDARAADGFIVGTALKRAGRVDPERARAVRAAITPAADS